MNDDSPRIAALVVAHDAGESVLPTLRSLAGQVESVIVVDNASSDDTARILGEYAAGEPSAVILHHPMNNLAAAQNLGIRCALASGADLVLLMDDDSEASPGMVAALSGLLRLPGIGFAAPLLRERSSNREPRYLRRSTSPFFRRTRLPARPATDLLCAIASGSLVPRATFDRVGYMDETLVIDEVDRDFSLRVIRSGLKIAATRDAVLLHSLGQSRDHSLLGLPVTTRNHAAFRRYYIYRNRLRMWRRHGMAVPAFLLSDILALGLDFVRLVFLEQDRATKLKSAGRGMIDAIRGITGPRPAGSSS